MDGTRSPSTAAFGGERDGCARSPHLPRTERIARVRISAGSVSTASGTSTSSFSWTVTYTDLNNDPPTVKKVVIDGTGHDMTSADTT